MQRLASTIASITPNRSNAITNLLSHLVTASMLRRASVAMVLARRLERLKPSADAHEFQAGMFSHEDGSCIFPPSSKHYTFLTAVDSAVPVVLRKQDMKDHSISVVSARNPSLGWLARKH